MYPQNLANRITAILSQLEGWEKEDAEARAVAADPTNSLSSFVLEDLLAAAGTEAPRRTLRAFRRRLAEMGVTFDPKFPSIVEPDGIPDPERVEGLLTDLVNLLTEQVVTWFKPNSTSNASVEISINEHAAFVTLLRVASGRRPF